MGAMDLIQEAALRAELAKEAARIAEDAEFTGYQHLAAGQRWRIRAIPLLCSHGSPRSRLDLWL